MQNKSVIEIANTIENVMFFLTLFKICLLIFK